VADFDDRLDTVAKIVGVSDDLDRVRRCEADAQAAFGQRATANRSQPYYLDVTHKDANKGAVAAYLSAHLAVPAEEIATIGDQPNDVLMFKRSGLTSPWAMPRIRLNRRPMSRRIHTTTKALPRRSSASFCRLSVRAVSGSVEVDRPLFRHSRVSGNPGVSVACPWVPAFAGTTIHAKPRANLLLGG
jgi:hypothetical protein